ncbi:MAG: tetratricopeptide repeat protein [bacterium]|jgi:tetratricopeptide (TPR) repeat protein
MPPPSRQKLKERLAAAQTRQDLEPLLEEVNHQLKNRSDSTQLIHIRASIHTRMQQFGKAINDYRKILELDRDDKTAQQHIEQLQTILRYSANDIYANPNTNLDPWLE